MSIGIIAATPIELEIILQNLSKSKPSKSHKTLFYEGYISNLPVIACLCGVGKVNAAHGTTILLEKFNVDSIYTIGIGGAYPSSMLKLGDIAIAEKEIYGDEGLVSKDGFHTLKEINLPLLELGGVKYYNEFILYIPAELETFPYRGNFVTVSSCSGSLKRAFMLEQKFNALCENMEGAAIAHICTLYGKPNVEIRGISNIISERTAEPLSRSDILRAAYKVQEFFLDFLKAL
ncbi:MAG: futalosine hydrolase [Thermodesulfovibrionales bacterium]|nr:futalosine hydrolase [Thermodesulfovibrionales bacterium]